MWNSSCAFLCLLTNIKNFIWSYPKWQKTDTNTKSDSLFCPYRIKKRGQIQNWQNLRFCFLIIIIISTHISSFSVGWSIWIFSAETLCKFISYPLHRVHAWGLCWGWSRIRGLLLLLLISRLDCRLQSVRSEPFFRQAPLKKRNTGGKVGQTIHPTGNVLAHQDCCQGSGKVVAIPGH